MKKILLEDISFAYRMPKEFIGFGTKLFGAIIIWAFWYWNNDMCGVWQSVGIRIFGFEINIKLWK